MEDTFEPKALKRVNEPSDAPVVEEQRGVGHSPKVEIAATSTDSGVSVQVGMGAGESQIPDGSAVGRFIDKFQKSAPYLATVAVLGIGALTLKAQGQVQEWARDVVRTDFIDNAHEQENAAKRLVGHSTFREAVVSEVENVTEKEKFWNQIREESQKAARVAAIEEAAKMDADRAGRLLAEMLKRDELRLLIVDRLTQDPNIQRDFLLEVAKDPKNLEIVRGKQGAPGAQGLPGKDGLPGVPGKDGKDGSPGKEGPQGLPGKEGKEGPEGPPGKEGKEGLQGLPGKEGKEGPQGPPGKEGKEGPQGLPGKDAKAAT